MVSIPYSTIKRILKLKRPINEDVSIPYSTIKSIKSTPITTVMVKFQFLIVQLKVSLILS